MMKVAKKRLILSGFSAFLATCGVEAMEDLPAESKMQPLVDDYLGSFDSLPEDRRKVTLSYLSENFFMGEGALGDELLEQMPVMEYRLMLASIALMALLCVMVTIIAVRSHWLTKLRKGGSKSTDNGEQSIEDFKDPLVLRNPSRIDTESNYSENNNGVVIRALERADISSSSGEDASPLRY